jgi:glycosyltransferase involved in cell wall biosynthesis
VTFSVVIPSARASNLVECVRALLANEPELPPERIVVVDDGARAEAEPLLPGVRWVAGEKPFVFARNANIGIRAAATDVVLLNDDACLVSPHGLSQLAEVVRQHPELGVCSAGITGVVGNPRQRVLAQPGLRYEHDSLAFVCVYLPWHIYADIGALDERFTGYGFEDTDYCLRLRTAGRRLGIWDACIVDHSGRLPSTFRARPDITAAFAHNQQLFRQKVAAAAQPASAPVDQQRRVDLLYLACNRLEFTRETFSALIANTDWDRVQQCVVFDDGSVDGTAEWLQANIARVPAPTHFARTRFGSPVTAMVDFIRSSRAPILAKTDNDAMLPPGWLRQSLAVLDRHPELALLGIEAMYPHNADAALERTYAPAQFISGLGLYRRSAFARSVPRMFRRWFGLEEWQMAQGTALGRGWITPALPVFLLDRLPMQPWRTYSDAYIRQGWQRPWPAYDARSSLWEWWLAGLSQPDMDTTGDPRVVGAMRIKNEAAHLDEALSAALRLCDRVVVFDDHSTDATPEICRSFGERVTVYASPFAGLDEARDKNFLLDKVCQTDAEWVLWIDGDEVLEPAGPDALRAEIERSGPAAVFSLRIAYVWNSPQLVRVDGVYGQFRRQSLFRLRGQSLERLSFRPSGRGGNLHCGNVPSGLIGDCRPLDVRLKHYGYMTPEQRRAKYVWYTQVDPNNVLEDNYRHLAEIPGARHAPGPARLVPWTD